MRLAAAASREAGAGSGASATPRPYTSLAAGSRLLAGTAASRARSMPGASAQAGSLKNLLWSEAGRPVARAQRTRLEAVALVTQRQG